jgi:hypothetical protein
LTERDRRTKRETEEKDFRELKERLKRKRSRTALKPNESESVCGYGGRQGKNANARRSESRTKKAKKGGSGFEGHGCGYLRGNQSAISIDEHFKSTLSSLNHK